MTIEPTDVNQEPDMDLDEFSNLFHEVKTEKTDVKEVEEDLDENDKEEAEPEAPTAEEDLDEGDEPEEKPKTPLKKNRFQERIDKLTAEANEAKRALAALRAEKEKPEAPAAKPTAVQQVDDIDPDAKNEDGSEKYPLGEFDPKYIRDLARQTIAQERAAWNEEQARQAVENEEQAARAQLQEQWTEKLSTVSEKHEDFLEKTLELEEAFDGLEPRYSDYLVQTIKSLSNGPEVLYYFANNLDEAKKFVQLGPLQATLALGEYNSMFKGASKKTVKTSQAPPPPQLNKGAATRTSVRGDTDDLDAFEKLFFKP